MKGRLEPHAYRPCGEPRATGAGTSRLERFWGEGWLAAGDAAISFDPLSSQGILTALYAGLKAAEALQSHLSGNPGALDSYSRDLESVYSHYLHNRTASPPKKTPPPDPSRWSDD
ncbi:MAG: hypothetical protein V3T83_16655 [Acidobacteriota bacterium]